MGQKAADEETIRNLNSLSDIAYSFSKTFTISNKDRDLGAEIVTLKHKNKRLDEEMRRNELMYKDVFTNRDNYKKQVFTLTKNIRDMEKGRKAEKDADRVMMEKKDTQIEELKETIEHWKQKVANVNASMEGMEINHKKKVGTIIENHMTQTEGDNAEKLKLKIKVVELEDKNRNDVRDLMDQIENLKKARKEMNATLRERDTEIREKKAVIEDGR